MARAPYTSEAGYEVIAGQDVTDRRYNTTRYMLLYNRSLKVNKSVILTASGKRRADWKLFAEGKLANMTELFDKIENGTAAS